MHLYYITVFLVFIGNISAQPLVIAHRGASANKPENSISAFEEAIKLKADYIETDVHQTRDGIVVIMHDFSVKRTCDNYPENKTGIKDLNFLEFSSLKIKGANEHPPSLDSAIKFIKGRCKLLLEIKKVVIIIRVLKTIF